MQQRCCCNSNSNSKEAGASLLSTIPMHRNAAGARAKQLMQLCLQPCACPYRTEWFHRHSCAAVMPRDARYRKRLISGRVVTVTTTASCNSCHSPARPRTAKLSDAPPEHRCRQRKCAALRVDGMARIPACNTGTDAKWKAATHAYLICKWRQGVIDDKQPKRTAAA
jgi:hypothetical protein